MLLRVSSSHCNSSHQLDSPSIFFKLLVALLESNGSFLSVGQLYTAISVREGNGKACSEMLLRFGRSSKITPLSLENMPRFSETPPSSPISSSMDSHLDFSYSKKFKTWDVNKPCQVQQLWELRNNYMAKALEV